MNRFSLPDKTLRLLAAQVNLNGTFNHRCHLQNIPQPLIFSLQVERGPAATLFTLVMADEKNSLTVHNPDHDTHRVLADFIETVATGRMDTAEPATPRISAESVERGQLLDTQQQAQLQQLVRTGGALRLDIGLEHAVCLAVHRTLSRTGITVILVAGSECPRTQCFTAYGDDQHSLDRLLQSLNHLVAPATAAALAA